MTASSQLDAVDTDSFDAAVLLAERPVLVDFWASWCGTCRLLAPVLRDVAAEVADRISVVTVDADAHPEIGQRFGVLGLPTLLLFADGAEQLRIGGAQGKAALLRQLGPWLDAR